MKPRAPMPATPRRRAGERGRGAEGVDFDAPVAEVLDVAGQAELPRRPLDEEPEAHPLHAPLDPIPPRHVHGRARDSTGVIRPQATRGASARLLLPEGFCYN